MILQHIVDLVELLATKGVKNAIVSPGSRNAPLTIALARHPNIDSKSISDERSAGFIALGMAQTLNQPVVLCCTSGSAVYNYAPAVAEAFFQEIPLIILSADRPKEWIHQHDGQTIYQQDIFGKHVKKSFSLGADFQHNDASWEVNRLVNEAVNTANTFPKGPVHINVPLREPFYPEKNENIVFKKVRNIEILSSEKTLSLHDVSALHEMILKGKKVLLAIGQHHLDSEFISQIKEFSNKYQIPIVGDIISNLGNDFIHNHDFFASKLTPEFVPDILITYGKSFISKSFKTFLRNNYIATHIHFQENELHIDTFQSVTHLIYANFKAFIDSNSQIMNNLERNKLERIEYKLNLEKLDLQWNDKKRIFWNEALAFNELSVFEVFLNKIPSNSVLHLANSMTVRYANHIGLSTVGQIEVFANRGTSGIDGCVSSAVGCALATDKLVFLIVGDVAFFYDRNALWNNYLPNNLRIILLNNHGGGIFRMLEGSSAQPELEEFFETNQTMNAKNTSEDAGLNYNLVKSISDFNNVLPSFINSNSPASIIEIESSAIVNTEIFKLFKKM
ncbi:MAG: 2-succinyl-5-enolpyruvyl-6-hydroxy-3-cyclohexene-1-carboxylic-acid synthase [Pseudarcicella sp.]|nr:2-succinyl-5-enolpyruvyl-6-hydroxy-3-cyclohexene-1-carboxylic-acid synthase [Pseudarcicella sp.]